MTDEPTAGHAPPSFSFPIAETAVFPTFRRSSVFHPAPGATGIDLVAAVALVLSRHNDDRPVQLCLRTETSASAPVTLHVDFSVSGNKLTEEASNRLQQCHIDAQAVIIEIGSIGGLGLTPVEARFRQRSDDIVLDYSTDHFDQFTASGIIEQVALALEQLACPAPLRDVDILSASQSARIVDRDSRRSPGELPDPWKLIIDAEQAHPDRVAIVDATGSLTYGDLMGHVRITLSDMAVNGIVEGSVVTIPIEPSRWTVVAMLAALGARACYVPLDADLPDARRRSILEQVDATAALVTDSGGLRIQHYADGGQHAVSLPGKPCYVLFTSGSTGAPKGVAISRRSLSALLWATTPEMNRDAHEIWTLLHSFAFDASVWELYGALCFGGTVVIASTEQRRDPSWLLRAIEDHQITSVTITPTAFGAFTRTVPPGYQPPPTLKRIILCAEALSVPTVDKWIDSYGDECPVLLNMYGITETTVHSTIERLRRSKGKQRVRIGVGLADTPIYVVDGDSRLVPDGVAGEMLVGGAGVALGYVGESRDLLDQRFVPDTLSGEQSARLYRSGDTARRLADGTLEYLGRRDHQLKIRGHRVEAGDVEAAALTMDRVSTARAWAEPVEHFSTRLCLAVTAEEPRPTSATIRDHLRARLPRYMTPDVIVVVDDFPQTINGKLDTAALLDIQRDDLHQRANSTLADITTPSTSPLSAVAQAISTVLGLGDLPADANFFTVGGDSISAVQLVETLRQQRLLVNLDAIYRHRTVADIAATARHLTAAPGVEHRTAHAPLRATPLQRGMLYHSIAHKNSLYHDLLHYRVNVRLDESLNEAAEVVTARHPALRSSFAPSPDGSIEQRIAEKASLELSVHDLEDATQFADRIQRWSQHQWTRGFDIARPGLLRLAVHRTADASVLSLSVHHAILDGWSASQFVAELLARWACPDSGPEHTPETSMAVLHHHEKLVTQSRSDPAAREYWSQRLKASGSAVLDRNTSGGGPRTLRLTLSATDCTTLDRYAVELGMPPRAAFSALHRMATAALTPMDAAPLACGLVTSGRPEILGSATTLGLFLNTHPLPTVTGSSSWRSAIHDTFDLDVAATPFRRFPLADMQDIAGGPLVDLAFNYTQFRALTAPEQHGVAIDCAWYDERTEFPVLVTVNRGPHTDDSELTLVVNAGAPADLEHRYVSAFQALLASAVTSIDGEIDLDTVRELVAEAGAPAVHLSGPRRSSDWNDVLTAVQSNADRFPNQPALIDGDDTRTFARFLADVETRARELIRHGASDGTRVLIESDRCADMVVTALAAWTIGASVVPLDTALPPKRRQLLANMVGPAVHVRVPSNGTPTTPVQISGPARSTPHAGVPPSEAYLLFTSGTTGTPKGVSMPREALANLITWQVGRFGPQGPGKVALFAPVGFDVSLQEMLSSLAAGGTLVVVPTDTKLDPIATLRLLRRQSVDVLFTPPLILRMLARAWAATGESPALRWVITAGEQLVIDDVIRNFGSASGFRLANQYGPTETHVVTECDLGEEPTHWPDRPVIGRPIDNVDIVVNAVQSGAGAGELVVCGPAVGLGYLATNAATPQQTGGFSASTPRRRHFATGDLVTAQSDGLAFGGRLDEQVKVRGYRVDLAEVEQILRGIESVTDCAVHVVHTAGGAALHVTIQTDQITALNDDAVRSQLGEQLPYYAIPETIEITERLRTDHRGKVDRTKPNTRHVRSRTRANHSPLERTVLNAWSVVLKRQQTTTDETFFAAGGSSVLLLDLYLVLRDKVAAPFEILDLLQYPTVSAFVGFLRSSETKGVKGDHTSCP